MEVKLTEIKPEYLHIDYINKNYVSKSILRKLVERYREMNTYDWDCRVENICNEIEEELLGGEL
jgi:hypothetical protein